MQIPDLVRELGALLRQIPAGRVTTYGSLADALGDRVAARWVATFLRRHSHDSTCACHRVVRVSGELAGCAGGDALAQAARLQSEGVAVVEGRVALAEYGDCEFQSTRPLATLRAYQDQLAADVTPTRFGKEPGTVGGVDVSYGPGETACAAFALVEYSSGRLVWQTVIQRPVEFPYVSTYLAFRELPVYLALLDSVRGSGRLPDVLLVDGSGQLHPRHLGIATHLGIETGLSTIGVTKKLLVGRWADKDRAIADCLPILVDGVAVGLAMYPSSKPSHPGGQGATIGKPLFVSPGHRVGLEEAGTIVRAVWREHRLPEPIYWADRLSRQASRSKSATAIPIGQAR